MIQRQEQSNESGDAIDRFNYWVPAGHFERVRDDLASQGYTVTAARLTPCRVLRASGNSVVYAPPERWNGMCRRQGSWYRESHRRGQYLLVADHELPGECAQFLDSHMSASYFEPESLPTRAQLEDVVNSDAYTTNKPREWEGVTWFDVVSFKVFFRLLRFWKRGEGMKKHWLGHRANHANFLAKRFTANIDGENVAHSVTGNGGVCSSCVEFFNLIEPESRKLVRACPGSVTFAGAERETFYDVRPVKLTVGATQEVSPA